MNLHLTITVADDAKDKEQEIIASLVEWARENGVAVIAPQHIARPDVP